MVAPEQYIGQQERKITRSVKVRNCKIKFPMTRLHNEINTDCIYCVVTTTAPSTTFEFFVSKAHIETNGNVYAYILTPIGSSNKIEATNGSDHYTNQIIWKMWNSATGTKPLKIINRAIRLNNPDEWLSMPILK